MLTDYENRNLVYKYEILNKIFNISKKKISSLSVY